jgi:hypothetical protein
MGGAGRANQIFRGLGKEDQNILTRLRAALSPLFLAESTNDAIEAAVACLARMTQEEGIAQGVAARLMACARPDVAISLNGASADRLGEMAGLPRSPQMLAQPENYRALLRWLSARSWYTAQRPLDSWQSALWDMRAALIDCFVYEP